MHGKELLVGGYTAGQVVQDSFTFEASDGTTQQVTVTITGAEDASVITGTFTGAVSEDNVLTATGALAITDADTSDNPVGFADVAATAGDNGYGTFELTGGEVAYLHHHHVVPGPPRCGDHVRLDQAVREPPRHQRCPRPD